MKELTIKEFQRLCDDNPDALFLFDSYYQGNADICDVEIISMYNKVTTMKNPNRVFFTDGSNSICFNRVNKIKYNHNKMEPDELTFSCGNYKKPSDCNDFTVFVVW